MSASYRCRVCAVQLTIKRAAGRTKNYCSNRCRSTARRNANFRDFGVTMGRGSAATRNLQKNLGKTTPKPGALADQASSISSPIEVLGGRYSWCRPTSAQARLIANAVAAELGNYVLPSPSREGGAS
jgi:hypothetical protein